MRPYCPAIRHFLDCHGNYKLKTENDKFKITVCRHVLIGGAIGHQTQQIVWLCYKGLQFSVCHSLEIYGWVFYKNEWKNKPCTSAMATKCFVK